MTLRRFGYTRLWLLWLGAFLVIEGAAIADREPNDTLSEHIWRWCGRGKRKTWQVRSRRILFLAFAAWLVFHLISGAKDDESWV